MDLENRYKVLKEQLDKRKQEKIVLETSIKNIEANIAECDVEILRLTKAENITEAGEKYKSMKEKLDSDLLSLENALKEFEGTVDGFNL